MAIHTYHYRSPILLEMEVWLSPLRPFERQVWIRARMLPFASVVYPLLWSLEQI